MTGKAKFNAEEWSVVVGAALLSAMMVIASEKGGGVRESLAVARAYGEAREQYDGEFMSALLAAPPATDAAKRPRSREEVHDEALAALRDALAILERVATEDEVIEYKRFVFALGETVARAHREGGFLGIGGKAVSEQEQAALDEIAAVFDEPPSA